MMGPWASLHFVCIICDIKNDSFACFIFSAYLHVANHNKAQPLQRYGEDVCEPDSKSLSSLLFFSQWKLSVHVWDVLPKVAIDLGDVFAVTLCINALTFSSCFRSNVAQAGKKDGYREDEICHKERNETHSPSTVVVPHINHCCYGTNNSYSYYSNIQGLPEVERAQKIAAAK